MPYEFVSGFDAELGALARRAPHIAQHLHGLRARLKQAAESEAAMAARAARHPLLTEREPGPGMELPFPIGTVTLTKSGGATPSGSVSNNFQGVAYRIERLICDDAIASAALQVVEVTDIKLMNISQNCASANQLASFYGPTAWNTPFEGMTLNQNAQALVSFNVLDTVNGHTPYAALFGNAVR